MGDARRELRRGLIGTAYTDQINCCTGAQQRQSLRKKLSIETSHFRRPYRAQCTAMIAFQVAGGGGMPGGMTKENLNQKALGFKIRLLHYVTLRYLCSRSEQ